MSLFVQFKNLNFKYDIFKLNFEITSNEKVVNKTFIELIKITNFV